MTYARRTAAPPCSTRSTETCALFPYTTLFRSLRARRPRGRPGSCRPRRLRRRRSSRGILPRSEEHTSELQSRLHLVCRLLLEKKNDADALDSLDGTAAIELARHMPFTESKVEH